MENTTNLMLAQFAAGLVHFADYKRCKVLGDLLGVDDPTTGPALDHRAALFLYRLLAELRTVQSVRKTFILTLGLCRRSPAAALRCRKIS